MTILLVDAGNTRVKWAIAQADSFNLNDRWLKFGNFNHEDTHENSFYLLSQTIRPVKKIICSSVIGKEKTTLLKTRLMALHPTAHWHEICGNSALSIISTTYIAPEKLGSDRRAMILGAAGLFPNRNILIICTGTATTIDLLTSKNEHLGGLIFPGITLMSQALHAGTAKLPDVFSHNTPIKTLELGVDTQSSIYNGILASQLGAIELGKRLAHQQNIQLDMLLVDGGNAELLINAYQGSEQILFSSNLVLKGLLAWHHQGYI
jgi:type III pantothenate kinase